MCEFFGDGDGFGRDVLGVDFVENIMFGNCMF